MNDDEPFTEVRVEKAAMTACTATISICRTHWQRKVEYYMRAGDGSNVSSTERNDTARTAHFEGTQAECKRRRNRFRKMLLKPHQKAAF
ncbi:hypothetical protein PO124_33900 [Bacillus licheniformis]|nr:hypothetical protein [Bacillus licheniformis]